MSRGLSKQQKHALKLLKERGEIWPKFPWMGTREIVMTLHPEVQAYLDEEKRYYRKARGFIGLPFAAIHEEYERHQRRLASLPNYHTARTSVNRALRNLVKRGLVCRQEHWGMFQHEGIEAGWLLVENMNDRFREDSEMLKYRSKADQLKILKRTEEG